MPSSWAMSFWRLPVALGPCRASCLSVLRSRVSFRKLVRKGGAKRALTQKEKWGWKAGIVVF